MKQAPSWWRRFFLAAVMLIGVAPAPLWAATFIVNSTLDATDASRGNGVCETAPGNGVCTLRAAIQETNSLAGPDTIIVPAGTYVLTLPPSGTTNDANGSLDLMGDVDIIGDGPGVTIIDGGGLDSVFATVVVNRVINISRLTIQNGSTSAFRVGGGIWANANANVTLTDVVVRDNHAGDGGGIYNQGNLTLIRTVVEGNTAIRTAADSREFRQGGGIFHNRGVLVIRDSIIRDNTAVTGGGLYNLATAIIESSTFSGNISTNTVLNDGDGGGGIVNGGAFPGTMTITNSTVSGNRANGHYGGIYNASGTLTINNTTIADNVADADNDGFGLGGGLGLGTEATATALVRNSIVARNVAGAGFSDCASPIAGALTSGGYNLFGALGSAVECAFTPAPGDLTGTTASPLDPGLMPLGDYGGPTPTHALASASPAIDAGDPNGCSDGAVPLATDQRGSPRPMGARCDIGAYENARPTADAGPDQRVNPGAVVQLDGSASAALGGVQSYAWTQVSGAPVTLSGADTATPSFTAPAEAGELVFSLTVADALGATASDTVTVSVNAAPVANAGADQTVNAGAAVALNGSASADADGVIATYAWSQLSGPGVTLSGANTATPSFVAPASSATLTFQLTVTDNEGASHSDTVTITVNAPASGNKNKPPVAKAGPDRTKRSNAVVVLNGWKSYDPDGRIVSYRWTQIGGPRVNLHGHKLPWATFVAPKKDAVLTFQLTVTDNKGATSTDTVTITVKYCKARWYERFFGWHKHGHKCR